MAGSSCPVVSTRNDLNHFVKPVESGRGGREKQKNADQLR